MSLLCTQKYNEIYLNTYWGGGGRGSFRKHNVFRSYSQVYSQYITRTASSEVMFLGRSWKRQGMSPKCPQTQHAPSLRNTAYIQKATESPECNDTTTYYSPALAAPNLILSDHRVLPPHKHTAPPPPQQQPTMATSPPPDASIDSAFPLPQLPAPS